MYHFRLYTASFSGLRAVRTHSKHTNAALIMIIIIFNIETIDSKGK